MTGVSYHAHEQDPQHFKLLLELALMILIILAEMQEDLHRLVEWADKWQMQFNVSKLSLIHI